MANKDDQNPDDLMDFEPEGDFSEFEDDKSATSLGQTVKNNPLIKIVLVVVGLVVVIGGVMMFGGEKAEAPRSSVGAPNDIKETPGTKELTPLMNEAMEEYNQQRIQEAVNQGSSVMPVPIDPPKTFLPAPSDAATTEDPLQRWRLMQEERLKVQREQEQLQVQSQQSGQNDPANQQAVQQMAASMSAKMSEILSSAPARTISYMKVTEDKTQAGGVGAAGAGGALGPGGAMANREPLEVVIQAGQILYAQLLNEANSYVKGPIIALLAQGPFSGSRVLGSFEKKEELLVMRFNTLVTKEGFSVPITAYAMDPDTTLVGMATEVDHRYWKRVILPAAAEFIQGVGEAIADSGSNTSVTVNGGSTAVEQNNDFDTREELAKGVENAFEKVGDILDDEGSDTEIRVIVKAGTPLGLLFMESVTKQSIEEARYGRSAVNGQQPQQMQQQQTGFPFGNMFGMNGQQMQPGYGYQGQAYPASGYPAPSVPNNYGFAPTSGGSFGSVLQGLQTQQGLQTGSE